MRLEYQVTEIFMYFYMKHWEKQIKCIRENGDIATDSTEKQGIIRYQNEQLYANKVHTLEEMDTFLETYLHTYITLTRTES